MESITRVLGEVAVIRAMPNTPLLLGCGTVALTHNDKATAQDFAFVRRVFESVGTVYELPENKLNEVINVNGSTAYKLEDYLAAAEMIKSGKIDADKIVTHHFKIDEFQQAYDVCVAGTGLKVIIEP